MYSRILIVEDETNLRQALARNLARRGHVVREAGTAEEAICALLEDQPDLLLLDINLPDRSGWDILRQLRQHGVEVPTIVISAVRVSPGRLAEFRPLAFLPKPFPLEALLRLVRGEPKLERAVEPPALVADSGAVRLPTGQRRL